MNLMLLRAEPRRAPVVIGQLLVVALCAGPLAAGEPAAPGSESHAARRLPTTNTVAAASNDLSAEGVLNALRQADHQLASSNLMTTVHQGGTPVVQGLAQQLEVARQQRLLRQNKAAAPNFIAILNSPNATEPMRQVALLELGLIAQEENDLPKALQILAQYHSRWPDNVSVPEILLRQGLIYRRMGSPQTALTKFYAVMTSALVLKTTQFDYYQRLVLQAQTEIADTHYQLGQHREAVDFLSRLLKMNEQALNRPQLQYKLLRSLAGLNRHDQVVAQAEDFLARFPDAPEQPEVRFLCATALRQLGRPAEALQQVLALLSEQREANGGKPETYAYWQQRLGNEIANQLYREGDYGKALDVYVRLAQLDASPAWQLPVQYQVGMSFERLDQPIKAIETYTQILAREKELGTNATPSLRAVLEMARWRRDYLQWQGKAEAANRQLKASIMEAANATTNAALSPGTNSLPPASGGISADIGDSRLAVRPLPRPDGSAAEGATTNPAVQASSPATNLIILQPADVVVVRIEPPPPPVIAAPDAPVEAPGPASSPRLAPDSEPALGAPTNNPALPSPATGSERLKSAAPGGASPFRPSRSRFSIGGRDGLGAGPD
jgi:tetratricopeptide (TPR) repeat protein